MKIKDLVDLKGCYSAYDVGEKEISIETGWGKVIELNKEITRLEDNLEQERVRLAGCLCIAEGYIDNTVKKGVYGWSLAYERIKDLRVIVDNLPSEDEIHDILATVQCSKICGYSDIRRTAQAIFNRLKGTKKGVRG